MTTTAVMITGTSSGIGRATVVRLARRPDLTVWATARRPESIRDLADAGARTLALDVTDEQSRREAVEAVRAEHGAVGVLVNNAGYGEYGTVEEGDLDRVRRQFETNVFGLCRMTQLVLPGMRAAGSGRIVNVGSMGGRLVFPVGGYYHASKYAVEAITDALRFEVAPFGITTSLIEPGLVRTEFTATASGTLSATRGHVDTVSPYAGLNDLAEQQIHSAHDSAMATGSDAVAKAIEHAATARRPRVRYVITPAAKALIHTRRLFGARVFDAILRAQYRTPARR